MYCQGYFFERFGFFCFNTVAHEVVKVYDFVLAMPTELTSLARVMARNRHRASHLDDFVADGQLNGRIVFPNNNIDTATLEFSREV